MDELPAISAARPETDDFALSPDRPSSPVPEPRSSRFRWWRMSALVLTATIIVFVVILIARSTKMSLKAQSDTEAVNSIRGYFQRNGETSSTSESSLPGPEEVVPASSDGFRLWTDSTGKFHVTARLVTATDEKVTLERQNGTAVDVPMVRLSPDDQTFVRNRLN